MYVMHKCKNQQNWLLSIQLQKTAAILTTVWYAILTQSQSQQDIAAELIEL